MELVVVSILVQAGLWINGTTRGKIILLGMVWLALTTLWDKTSPKEMGLSFKNFRENLWLIEPVAIALSLIWLTGLLTGSARQTKVPGVFLEHKFGYVLGAFFQQFVMQSYVFTRLQKLTPEKATWITAIFFSLSHVPNPALMVIALVGGWASNRIFAVQRSLPALGLAHGVIGAAMAEFLPGWLMLAGGGFLRWFLRWYNA